MHEKAFLNKTTVCEEGKTGIHASMRKLFAQKRRKDS